MSKYDHKINDKLRFVIIGSTNTLFALALFTTLISFLRPGIQVLYVIVLSSGISYVSGYFLYKNFLWSKSPASIAEFVRFVKSNLFFLALNLMSLHFFVNIFYFDPVIVQLITTGSLVIVSFVVHDRWTFGQSVKVPQEDNFTKANNE